VFVPAAAPQAAGADAAYGGQVIRVAGSYDQAFDLCCAACDRFGWYNRNTALNPFTVEGKKTAALEIVRQLAGNRPDVVVVPSGDGVIISGVAKGFADLVEAGLLARSPRLLAVQPAGSNALVAALATGRNRRAAPRRGERRRLAGRRGAARGAPRVAPDSCKWRSRHRCGRRMIVARDRPAPTGVR
jgi:threonine synthase